jgi:hypothetical protein
MRRVTFALFVCLAACGGTEAVKPAPVSAGNRQSFLNTPAARQIIAYYSNLASSDALDTCLNAWVGDDGPSGAQEGPVSKPDLTSLRSFLSECLGVPAPPPGGDARMSGTAASARRQVARADMRGAAARSF